MCIMRSSYGVNCMAKAGKFIGPMPLLFLLYHMQRAEYIDIENMDHTTAHVAYTIVLIR